MKHGEKIKQKILDVGVSIWPDVTLSSVARAAGFKSHASVSYYFPNDELKDAVAAHAVETNNSRVIVQLLAINHKTVKRMPKDQREKHLRKIGKSART